MHATYDTASQAPTLNFERQLKHPVETVWRAITDPRELKHWFPSTISGEFGLGAQLTFTFEDHDEIEPMRGEVTEYEPPRRLAFNWGAARLQSELQPAAGGGCGPRFTVKLCGEDKDAPDVSGRPCWP